MAAKNEHDFAGGMMESYLSSLMARLQAGKEPVVRGALENKIEAAFKQGLAKSMDDFKRIAEQHFKELASRRQPQNPTPPPPNTPNPPPLGGGGSPPPPGGGGPPPPKSLTQLATEGSGNAAALKLKFLKEQEDTDRRMAEARRNAMSQQPAQQAAPPDNKPPPVPLHIARLSNLAGAAMERTQDVLDFHRQNPNMGPQSLLGKHKRRAMTDYDKELAQQFEGLSPEESKRMMPIMESLEAKRKQVEEEELARREKLNKQLGTGERTLEGFIHGMAHGGPMGGALSALGGLGKEAGLVTAVLGGFAKLVMTVENERLAGIRQGGRALSPSGAATEEMSVRLREAEQARQTGELGRQEQQARMEQLQRQAIRMGMTTEQDPRGALQRTSPLTMGAELAYRALDLFRGFSAQERSARQAERFGRSYEDFIRQRGGTPDQFKRDIPNLTQPGYTTARGLHEQMQIGGLQREDLTNDLLRQQVETLRQAGLLLEGIRNNTNGLENLIPRWS